MKLRALDGVAALAVTTIIVLPSFAGEYRSIDGTGNNLANPSWGSAHSDLLRRTTPGYADGKAVPTGGDPTSLPSARAISNALSAQSGSKVNTHHATDWLWQWGQFLDHDLDLTPAGGTDAFDVLVPAGDADFDPMGTGTQAIGMTRSVFTADGGGVRQHPNEITAYIDASNVYGSDAARAAALRSHVGGKLLTSVGGNGEVLMVKNTLGVENDNGSSPTAVDADFFAAGDARANEQLGLTAAHTLFVREHNRLADDLSARLGVDTELDAKFNGFKATRTGLSEPEARDEFLYQSARKVVGAQMQKITYEEFLPLLMGDGAPDPSAVVYDPTVDAGVSTEFSSAAFRVGHTMLSPDLQRVNADGTSAGSVALKDAFFDNGDIDTHGVDTLLLGLASQRAQDIDTLVIDDVRNFLFGRPGAGGFDLASLNLQRGRDHGLGSLNDVRNELGLGTHASFLALAGGDADLAAAFASVYASIDDVDLWIGGLAEAHVDGGLLGETFQEILDDQFTRLAEGDRLFYLDDLNHLGVLDPMFQSTRLSDIILRNSSLTSIQDNVFVIPEPASGLLVLAGLGLVTRRYRS